MNRDTRCPLLIHPSAGSTGEYQSIAANDANWTYLHFGARMVGAGEQWSGDTGENEMCIVLLGGTFRISSQWGEWVTERGRRDVFSGFPHAAYLPPHTRFTLTGERNGADIAYGMTRGTDGFSGRLITPRDVNNHGVEFRGGDNASRQINSILPPGAACHRLVCVEVYTPSGNWSSFPAHKHDERIVGADGTLLEAELEEVYFYKFGKPQGFALQKIYTDDRSLNEIAEAHHNDAVLIPRGYHPVSAGHGYDTYYLNFLAGSDQSLANTSDPDHRWIFGSWKTMDPRLPLVTMEMNDVL